MGAITDEGRSSTQTASKALSCAGFLGNRSTLPQNFETFSISIVHYRLMNGQLYS